MSDDSDSFKARCSFTTAMAIARDYPHAKFVELRIVEIRNGTEQPALVANIDPDRMKDAKEAVRLTDPVNGGKAQS